jgi:peptide/nickel transport system substrate-binding protein
VITEAYRKAHERLDNPPWLYIVHDLNPRAMSPKVKGFVSPVLVRRFDPHQRAVK